MFLDEKNKPYKYGEKTFKNAVNKIKETALKVWNMVNGKDKNLDGKVDIKDAMLKAKQKAKKKQEK